MLFQNVVTIEKAALLLNDIEKNVDDAKILLMIGVQELVSVHCDDIEDYTEDCAKDTRYNFYISKNSLYEYLWKKPYLNIYFVHSQLSKL